MTHLNVTKITAGALIVAALLLGLYAWTLSRHSAPAAQATPVAVAAAPDTMFPTVIATRLLPAGTPITGDALRVVMLPVRPSGAFSDASLVTQRVPLSDIGPNVTVLEAYLSSGFAEQVGLGERAVAVHVDEASAVGNRIRPGNFVDVFFTLKREGAGVGPQAEVTRSQTRLLLSRVRVLAFGSTDSGAGNPAQVGVGVRTAVLAVPTADVDRLELADSTGHVLLALRNPRDEGGVAAADGQGARRAGLIRAGAAAAGSQPLAMQQAAAGVSLSELAGGFGATARAAARARSGPSHEAGAIEVIRGGRAQTLTE
ncbi:Flp pilus assembly protein CpaB [Trinickia sp.]|uniref:Flp pilus assembly protein CpaB n=1 Tax=Trinickia sp. TaxID=2571163 RepID=UPI003F807941